ncbi:protein POOR HOMOLOGOUS SYNAPSIS 1 [Mangifera indica]|uniref:protein POOR HOMOLOGOUS SYNAPSIS 1 n=1 Tax=Mangifera indica TaxID=29780 RepID=UPI001CF9F1A2|nr:protein POOR HOMOLOGOUS SYNAPSIS 1 [Mangifera indica]
MAGFLGMTAASEHLESHPVNISRDQWHHIHFSRFFTNRNPSLSSTCPSLVPLQRRYRSTHGTWISTSSPAASLLINNRSTCNPILYVYLQDKILEEHYVSKLRFSWPQVSCISGFPARGSRALFVSYRDSEGEIQKFALRFPTNYEAETFINALKEIFNSEEETEPLSSDFRSEISSRSDFVSSNRPQVCEELSIIDPVDTYTPEMPPNLSNEVEQPHYTQEIKVNHNFEVISPAMPPSFQSLLANCCPEVKKAEAHPTVNEEADLKAQIARYMEDSSFQDMLFKVDKIISEMRGDLTL